MSNSFSLSDLCSCPDPCPDCCEGCCSGLPSTLYCTLSTTAGTACEDGTVVTLTYNSGTQAWEGTAAFGTCGRDIILAFYCNTGGTTCGDYRLDVSFDDDCGGSVTLFTLSAITVAPLACTCSPLDVWFSLARISSAYRNDCSDGSGGLGISYWEVTT